MSDLESAAAALNVPEDILQRSAAARAAAAGTDTAAVLSAWAGGAPAPAASTTPEPTDTDTADTDTADTGDTGTDPGETDTGADPGDTGPTAPAQPAAQPVGSQTVVTVPAAPPILDGPDQRPFRIMAGAAAVFVLAILAGFVVPSLPEEGNGIYSSAIQMNQNAIDGKHLYRSAGCAACHTQMVRPIAIDAGLGGVTLSDTNQVLGVRRLGPDLAHVGTRIEDPVAFRDMLTAVSAHPSYAGLSDDELQRISDYLRASR